MADNRKAFAALDAQIGRIREIPGLALRAAPEIARDVELELAAQIARGEGPDGAKWKPKKDGGAPLVHAAKAIKVRAIGATIVVTIDGVEARHHLGAVRGAVRRQIIPTNTIPDPIAEAIDRVLTRRFASTMGR